MCLLLGTKIRQCHTAYNYAGCFPFPQQVTYRTLPWFGAASLAWSVDPLTYWSAAALSCTSCTMVLSALLGRDLSVGRGLLLRSSVPFPLLVLQYGMDSLWYCTCCIDPLRSRCIPT